MTEREIIAIRRLSRLLIILDEGSRKYLLGIADGMAFKEFGWEPPILAKKRRRKVKE